MRKMKMLCVSLSLILLSGCGNVPIDKEAVAQLDNIKINPDVTYAEKAFNNNPSRALGLSAGALVGGAVGGAAAAGLSDSGTDERDEMTAIIQDRSRLDEVAIECFRNALNNDPYWGPKLNNMSGSPDATFHLEVTFYGFSSYNFLADGAEPVFGLTAVLNDNDGNELWRYYRGMTDRPDDLPRYSVEEFLTEISRYDDAAEAICSELISKHMASLNDR